MGNNKNGFTSFFPQFRKAQVKQITREKLRNTKHFMSFAKSQIFRLNCVKRKGNMFFCVLIWAFLS